MSNVVNEQIMEEIHAKLEKLHVTSEEIHADDMGLYYMDTVENGNPEEPGYEVKNIKMRFDFPEGYEELLTLELGL